MPRQTTEILQDYAIVVRPHEHVVTDQHGNAIHDGHGNVMTEHQTHVVLIDKHNGDQIVVPLNDEGKQGLIRQLTGGIVIANGNLTP